MSEKLPLEYTERVGEAGQAYVESKSLNGRHTLPATFRWEELFEVMQRAALEKYAMSLPNIPALDPETVAKVVCVPADVEPVPMP